MIHVNEIFAYSHIRDIYYTDGHDVFRKINKEKNAKHYRVRFNKQSIRITEENASYVGKITLKHYVFYNGELYVQNKWQTDKNGYKFIITDPRGKRAKIAQHRLIYFFHNNIVPPDNTVIDHINRNKTDNDINNLRLVSPKENSNNTNDKQNSFARSKYLYQCYDILTNELVTDGFFTAGDISKIIGIDSGLVNRYAKLGFIFKSRYKITLKRKELHGSESMGMA